MKIHEVPEQYKIYLVRMSNGSEYEVNGITRQNIANSKSQWIEIKNGTTLNKSYIVELRLDKERTREEIRRNKDDVLNQIKK